MRQILPRGRFRTITVSKAGRAAGTSTALASPERKKSTIIIVSEAQINLNRRVCVHGRPEGRARGALAPLAGQK